MKRFSQAPHGSAGLLLVIVGLIGVVGAIVLLSESGAGSADSVGTVRLILAAASLHVISVLTGLAVGSLRRWVSVPAVIWLVALGAALFTVRGSQFRINLLVESGGSSIADLVAPIAAVLASAAVLALPVEAAVVIYLLARSVVEQMRRLA